MSAARRAVEVELHAINAAASRFETESELCRLNRAGGSWTAVSPRLLEALQLGVRAAALTGGAVEPTLGGELSGLGYDRDFEQLRHLPATRPLQRAVVAPPRSRKSRWAEIELRDDPPSARLPVGVQVDLGATAKALASDRAPDAAHTATAAGVLVSLGGDISTAGDYPDGGWPIRVTDDHRSEASEAGQTITIRDGGLAQAWMTVISVACAAAFTAAVLARVVIGWPERARLRLAVLGTLVAFAAGLAVWLPGGPLGADWAARAGTPPSLLPHAVAAPRSG